MPFAVSEALQLLSSAHQHNRLAHAYLITGPEGSGKRFLASSLMSRLLQCEEASVFEHPDVHSVAPESKSRRLVIDQIRDLEQKIRMRSLAGGKKFAVIMDADRMMPAAANAFLKTLEEPPSETHLLLLTQYPDQLLETILSRCVEVPLRRLQKPERTANESTLIQTLNRFFETRKPDLVSGLWLAQQFQSLLAAAKESIQDAMEAEAKAEEQKYKQTVDPKWFAQQEDLYAARTEAAYIAERSRLLELLEAFWTDVLLARKEQETRHLPECAEHSSKIASRISTAAAIQRVEAAAKMRSHLEMAGVNEALALEHGFLQAFAPQNA